MKEYPDKVLAYSNEKEVFFDLFKPEEILMQFLGEGAESNDDDKTTYIENHDKRYRAAFDYAEKYDAQVYTEVDGDDGEIYYSKGFKYCNRINLGLYTVVKVEGLKVNNS